VRSHSSPVARAALEPRDPARAGPRAAGAGGTISSHQRRRPPKPLAAGRSEHGTSRPRARSSPSSRLRHLPTGGLADGTGTSPDLRLEEGCSRTAATAAPQHLLSRWDCAAAPQNVVVRPEPEGGRSTDLLVMPPRCWRRCQDILGAGLALTLRRLAIRMLLVSRARGWALSLWCCAPRRACLRVRFVRVGGPRRISGRRPT
jgi:hypothetical protein